MLTLVHVGCQALVEWLEVGSVAVVVVVVEVAAVVFPWSRSTSPESGAGAGVPDVCGLSTTVLLLLLSVGRGQEG